jgi:hypothetical protein
MTMSFCMPEATGARFVDTVSHRSESRTLPSLSETSPASKTLKLKHRAKIANHLMESRARIVNTFLHILAGPHVGSLRLLCEVFEVGLDGAERILHVVNESANPASLVTYRAALGLTLSV